MVSAPSVALVSVAAAVSAALYIIKQRSLAKPTVTPATPVNASSKKTWDADELIKHRRSIFPQDYDKSRQVPREVVEKMLESANWAPTHGRTEPWRFVVFSSPAARERLGRLEADVYRKTVPPAKFLQHKYEQLIIQAKLQSSHVIAICMKRQESENLPEVEEVCAVAAAVQNLHLSATGHGVGGYWSSVPEIISDELRELFGLGPKDKCLGLFYIGYAKPGHVSKSARKSIKEKVKWVSE